LPSYELHGYEFLPVMLPPPRKRTRRSNTNIEPRPVLVLVLGALRQPTTTTAPPGAL
jgi:hypothetical protein